MIEKKDLRFIELARRIALKSDYPRKQVGVVLVKGHKVIAEGWNKLSHPDYRSLPGVDSLTYWSLHSEAAALLKVSDVRKSTAYLYGFKYGRPGNAAPCPLCKHYLRLRGVKRVVYTGVAGEQIHEELYV